MFFKTSNPAALLAWDQFMADCLKLRVVAGQYSAQVLVGVIFMA